MILSESESRFSSLTGSESSFHDRGRCSSMREGSQDLGMNMSITTDAEFDLEYSSSNNLGSVGNGSEGLESSSGSGLNDTLALVEELKLFSFRGFVLGSTTAHHIVLKGFGKNKLYNYSYLIF